MKKAVAVSFEGNSIKIVHASLRGSNLSVDKTEVIPDAEFDSYLQKEKAAEFIVTCEFRESFHNVLTVPVLKPKYLGKIVESEIRKTTGKKDFSFIYTLLGERVIENRKALEVFYFSVSNEEIRSIADRFYRNGKMVRAIYPSVFSAAALVDPSALGEANMGVIGAGKNRTVFFTKNSAIYFIRNYESIDTEIGSFDIQNINMTINYCFQNLRMSPSSVVLIGGLTGSSDVGTFPSVPLASLLQPDNVQCSTQEFNEFILPIASFFTPKPSNILSKDFRAIYALKQYLSYASKVFVILAGLCLGLIFYEAQEMVSQKEAIKLARQNMGDIERIASEYREREEQIRLYRPAVEFLNRPAPDIRALLIELAGINNKNFTFNELEAWAQDAGAYMVSIKGTVNSTTYSSLQALMQYLIDSLKNVKGVTIKNRTVSLKDKTFTIKIEYRNTDELF